MEMNRHCCAALHYAMLSDTIKNQIEIGARVYNPSQRNRNAARGPPTTQVCLIYWPSLWGEVVLRGRNSFIVFSGKQLDAVCIKELGWVIIAGYFSFSIVNAF